MADFIKLTLESWGFDHLVEKFIDEEFTKETFENLEYEILRDIIPKAGPLQAFWLRYKKEYRREETISVASTLSQPSSDLTSQSSIQTKYSEDSTVLIEDTQATDNISQELIFDNSTFNQFLRSPILYAKPSVHSIQMSNAVQEYIKCAEGYIVQNYYQKHKRLTGKEKNLLTNIIIQKEYDFCKFLNQEFKISGERFKNIVKEIVEIFPTEDTCIYFVSYNPKTKAKCSGKLWEAFNKLKRNLKECADKNQPKSSEDIPTTSPVSTVEDFQGKIKFLESHIDPWTKVESYWKETFCFRKHEINTITDQGSIYTYISKYAGLKSSKGYHLLAYDFDKLYPLATNKLFTEWSSINTKLVEKARNSKLKDAGDLLENQNDLTGFFLLPFFLGAAYSKKKPENYKRVKFTKEEITSSFILHITDGNLIQEKLESTRDQLKKNKRTLQPLVIVVGDSLHEICFSYVAVEDTLYKINDSPLTAIDICFKAFHALNAKYPHASEAIWTFIQKLVYGITTDYDRNFVAVNSLMADIKS